MAAGADQLALGDLSLDGLKGIPLLNHHSNMVYFLPTYMIEIHGDRRPALATVGAGVPLQAVHVLHSLGPPRGSALKVLGVPAALVARPTIPADTPTVELAALRLAGELVVVLRLLAVLADHYVYRGPKPPSSGA